MIATAADLCTCGECAELDRAHPREGRQLALVTSSGKRPVSLPLTDPDAPVCSSTDVSAPEGRTVETHALAAEAGDTSLMNAHTTIAKPPRGRIKPPAAEIVPPPPATPPRIVPSSPRLIELRRLRRAPENVRHTRVDEDVKPLADDIAAHGLLQSLIGYATIGARPDHLMPGEHPEDADVETIAWRECGGEAHIVGGGRRLQALQHLWDEGLIDGEFTVPVLIRDADEAIELSLSENLQQRTMSAVDEFFAFQALMDLGIYSPKTLAERFGFSERVVKQRLRLAQLDTEVLDALAERKITIDAAMAYAGSQDRALQREVFRAQVKKASSYSHAHRPDDIKWGLRSKGTTTEDQLFRYVGADAYEKRGGGYEDDLFLDSAEAGKVLSHPHLLQDLVRERIVLDMAARLQEFRDSPKLAPTIVGYVTTNNLRVDNYGNGAVAPRGLERVERYDAAPIWKTIRNNGIDVHVIAGIDSKGELVVCPSAMFVPKEQKEALAPQPAPSAHHVETPEQRAARVHEAEVYRWARRLAVPTFADTPFEGRVFWPSNRWDDEDQQKPFRLGDVDGFLIRANIFVPAKDALAQRGAAEGRLVQIAAERAAVEAERQRTVDADERRREARLAELRAMEPPAVIVVDGETWSRDEEGSYGPIEDASPGAGPTWSELLNQVDVDDIDATFATVTEHAAALANAGVSPPEEAEA